MTALFQRVPRSTFASWNPHYDGHQLELFGSDEEEDPSPRPMCAAYSKLTKQLGLNSLTANIGNALKRLRQAPSIDTSIIEVSSDDDNNSELSTKKMKIDSAGRYLAVD